MLDRFHFLVRLSRISRLMSWSQFYVRASCLILGLTTSVQAQERGPGGRRPRGQAADKEATNWASFGTGYLQLAAVADGSTLANWDFGGGFPITFSLEHVVGSGITLGVAGSYIRAPLVYFGTTSNGGCSSCNAHGTVATYGLVLHSGGASGGSKFYRLFRLFVGGIQFGSFEEDATKQTLPPDRANIDFLFSGGYGFGYALARDWHLELSADYMNSIHERKNLPNNVQTLSRHYLINLGLRVGF